MGAENNKKSILVVDDEADILKVISVRLGKSGYKVQIASSGKEALDSVEKEVPDLILLDIGLPDLDGIEVFRRIKEKQNVYGVPVIFFTARGTIKDKIKGLKEGVHDYITKPIDSRELLARIESVLKINEHYNEISLTDELTGLYNYNFFHRQFGHIFDLAKRYNRSFSLIVSDIDNFKEINDSCGHLCGNIVLKSTAERLMDKLRKVDIVTRYGGDEFAVILPETNYAQASEVLERLKDSLGRFKIEYKDRQVLVNLSFGLATFSEKVNTKEELFNIADKNMYLEKNSKKKNDLEKEGGKES